MMRIVRKSKSFSQKKRGYEIAKPANKFYSLLTQIDAIEKSLKRLKHTLKMYSDANNNPLRESIVLVQKYLDKYGDEIKESDKIMDILEVLDKFADKAQHTKSYNRINIQKSHRRYSEKPSNEIKEALEGFKELLELSPKEIAEVVEEEQKSKIRYDKIQSRNYDSSSSLATKKESWKKIIIDLTKQRLDEFAIKMFPRVKTTNKLLWISSAGVVAGFILVVTAGISFWPVLLFFTIIAALSGLSKLVNDFKTANLSQTHENILSDLNLLSYRMAKYGKYNDAEVSKVTNYIVYGDFVEDVSQTSKEAQDEPDLKTIAERVKDLLEHYNPKSNFKLE